MRNIKNKSFGREEGSPWGLSFLCNGEILGSQQQVNRRNKGNCLKKKREIISTRKKGNNNLQGWNKENLEIFELLLSYLSTDRYM